MKASKEKALIVFDRIAYWMLIFMPFSIAMAPAFTGISLGLLFFSFFAKKALKKEGFFVRTPVDTAFLFLLAASIISIGNSQDYQDSIKGVLKLIKYGFIFIIFAEELKDNLHAKRIVLGLILGACFASFDAAWQIIFGRDFFRGNLPMIHIGTLKRATAAFHHANDLAIYLVPAVVPVFALARYYFKGLMRILMLASGVLILSGITLTYSRPAGLACLLAFLFLGLIKKDKIILSLLALFLIIAPFVMPKDIKTWAKDAKYNPVILMCNADRISIYRNALNMIKHHPIIGVGVNRFCSSYPLYKLPEPPGAETEKTMYAHNNFLHMAGEIGLLGLSVFIWFLIALFKACAATYKNLTEPYLKIVSLSLVFSLAAFLINGLTESSLYYSRVAIIFWYVVGFVLALARLSIAKGEACNR